MDNFADFARTQMVRQQVRAWDVLDPAVLDVLARTPREAFVPSRFRSLAFADTSIPLEHGEVMMTPQVEGRLLQALALGPSDRVLEVGTGSGFLTACLAGLAGRVLSLEIHPDLSAGAARSLAAAGIGNADLKVADVFGFSPAERFDAIAVTGSVPEPWLPFREWLAVGGRLFVVVGREPVMEATLVERLGENEWSTRSLFETVLPPLRHIPIGPRFVF
jgi:protein-L-isoaspartate(D-aspartate) O-methyltransferase